MRVSAHMAVHVPEKLVQIEPLKASSPLCSGGRLLEQTKTKPPQRVSLPFIIVRTTAAALPVSQQNTPKCACVSKNHPLEVYISGRGAFYDEVGEIKEERGRNTRCC